MNGFNRRGQCALRGPISGPRPEREQPERRSIDTGLQFLNRTEPLLGVGGGVVFQGRSLTLDVGYRYKKIMTSGIAAAFDIGNAYQVNQVRVGLGFRF